MIERAIITGGGIGGLCAAIALQQAGIEAIVYEQADKLSPVGAGLTLWANAIKALRKLGLAESVINSGSKIERAEIRTASGRTLSRSHTGELEQLFGAPTIAIHRADLHDILLSALPVDSVRLGERCVGFDQNEARVTAHFAGGRKDEADLLVGSDGIHSVVRQQLFPEAKLRYAGYTAWRGVVATKDESALGLTSESWGRGSRFGILRIDKERVYWFATANAPAGAKRSVNDHKTQLLDLFSAWHHPVKLLLESTPSDQILNNDIYDLPPMKTWSKGRVTLLGDSAHPTTPNLGQGACMAIESSVVLARSISQGNNLQDSLKRYESERMGRTSWITQQSWKIGRIGQLENPIACALRDFVTSVTPVSVVRRTLEKAAGYEL